MKIEVCKYYRTRDGRKARIYAVDGDGTSEIHGAILHDDGQWHMASWCVDGMWLDDGSTNTSDLVSEWIDKPEVDWSAMPRWAEWVAMDEDGKWIWFLGEPRKGAANWCCYGVYGEIPHTYAPKWDGDWRDSLVRRTVEG